MSVGGVPGAVPGQQVPDASGRRTFCIKYCFAGYLEQVLPGGTVLFDKGYFADSIFTNAHNEWLTVLVDIGVLGLISYAGMMITAIRDFLRAGESKMLVGACGICVLAYTVNNMFSFQQVMNISTVFVIMGIGENLRSAPERCV